LIAVPSLEYDRSTKREPVLQFTISHLLSSLPNAAQPRDSPCTAAKMAILNQVMVEVFHVVERELQRRGLDGTQSSSPFPSPTSSSMSSVSASPTTMSTQSNSPGTGPTSSPLLFFVALGFGVVFTNLWSAFVAQIDL
jgi:hypothetical protein